MAKHILNAQKRTIKGRAVKKLRLQNIVPANIFGNKIKSLEIQTNSKEFLKLFLEVGESTLLYLKIDSEKEERPVLVADLVKHPVTGQLMHVAFHQVDLSEKVTANVPIELVGEAQAEKDKKGILVQQLDELEVEALPTKMPERFQVDISILAEVNDSILVSSLIEKTSDITIKTPTDSIIVKIEPLAKEEVAVPAVAVGEGPVAPTEGSEPAEGEAPAAAPAPEAKK